MSRFDDVYGGRWLKAGDLDGQSRQFQIEAAEWQEVGQEKENKLVLSFINKQKGLILNATNAKALAENWGKNEREWVGRWIEARAVETAFGPGVRVRPCEAPAAANSNVLPTADIPF